MSIKYRVAASLFKEQNKEYLDFDLKPRGYKVNEKEHEVFDSKNQAIGFFSGAGGLDIGAQLAGVKIISSMDFDKDSISTLKANSYFDHAEHLKADISKLNPSHYHNVLKANNPEKLILVGGPPCQPFSKAGYWVTHKNRLGEDDPRNMIGQYLRMVSDIRPDGFLLENVESILHPKNLPAAKALEESIDKLGYYCTTYKANAIDFGVPQKRKRVFFLASRKKIKGDPIKTHGSPSDLKISTHLKPYERVLDWIAKFDNEKFFEKEELTVGKTYEHELSEVPPGKNYIALTEHAGYHDPKFVAHKRFWSFLLKLHPDMPSWTIAAQPGPWVGPFHWTNRRLRVPEISALQTFPEDYIFIGSRRSIQRQIGNAVPCILAKEMVNFLIEQV